MELPPFNLESEFIEQFLFEVYKPQIELRSKAYKQSGLDNSEDVFKEAISILIANIEHSKSGLNRRFKEADKSEYLQLTKNTFEDVLGYIYSSDYDLIQRIRRGDGKATESFYVSCFNKIRKIVVNSELNNEDAKDIYHEGLITFLDKVRQPSFYLKEDTQISTFVFSICRNKVLNLVKKPFVTLVDDITNDSDYTMYFENISNVDEENNQNEDDLEISNWTQSILSILDESCRDLLMKKYAYGLPIERIAREENKSQGAIKMKLKRCKEKLRNVYNRKQKK